MFKNYLRTAVRNLTKNRVFSFINIVGLAVGLGVCMLITMIIHNQTNYDNFHPDGDRTYRVISKRTSRSSSTFSTSPFPLYEKIAHDFPGVEKALRIKKGFGGDARHGDKILPISGLMTEPAFFELFGFEMLHGNPATALEAPFSVVLTDESAEKYGLKGEQAIGEVLIIDGLGEFTVTGIVKEPVEQTHIKFEVLGSFASLQALDQANSMQSHLDEWNYTDDGYVYLRLEEQIEVEEIEALFPAISEEQYASNENFRLDFSLQALGDITPTQFYENDISYSLPEPMLLFLIVLALLVIITACFNYTNLSVARSLTRAKEVGIRKVVGARRYHIFFQFITEAVVLSMVSMFIAWGLLELFLVPQFEGLAIQQFLDLELETDAWLYGKFVLLAAGIGFAAGAFPALFLSRFKPLDVLKRLSTLRLGGRQGLRKVLIVFQFALSFFLIVSVTLLYHQTQYMLHADYGFNRDQVINLSLQGNDFEVLRNELGTHSSVTEVSGSSIIPASGSNQSTYFKLPSDEEEQMSHQLFMDHRYLNNMEHEMVAGKFFGPETAGSAEHEPFVILNETAVKRLGLGSPIEAIGQVIEIDVSKDGSKSVEVVGVVKNFHYEVMEDEIGSLSLRHRPDMLQFANIRIQSTDVQASLAHIDDSWKKVDQVHTANYAFFEDQMNMIMNIYGDIIAVVGLGCFLAVIIACLGLLGIATYNSETRVKEIGIRKVLGAGVLQIVLLLSRGFLTLLVVAILLTLPAAFYLNDLWLETFAYHVEWQFWHFGMGIGILLLLGGAMIGSQALRAAIANPVEALKNE